MPPEAFLRPWLPPACSSTRVLLHARPEAHFDTPPIPRPDRPLAVGPPDPATVTVIDSEPPDDFVLDRLERVGEVVAVEPIPADADEYHPDAEQHPGAAREGQPYRGRLTLHPLAAGRVGCRFAVPWVPSAATSPRAGHRVRRPSLESVFSATDAAGAAAFVGVSGDVSSTCLAYALCWTGVPGVQTHRSWGVLRDPPADPVARLPGRGRRAEVGFTGSATGTTSSCISTASAGKACGTRGSRPSGTPTWSGCSSTRRWFAPTATPPTRKKWVPPAGQALGRSRGVLSTKVHVAADALDGLVVRGGSSCRFGPRSVS